MARNNLTAAQRATGVVANRARIAAEMRLKEAHRDELAEYEREERILRGLPAEKHRALTYTQLKAQLEAAEAKLRELQN